MSTLQGTSEVPLAMTRARTTDASAQTPLPTAEGMYRVSILSTLDLFSDHRAPLPSAPQTDVAGPTDGLLEFPPGTLPLASNVTNSTYKRLASFRYEVRKFLAFSERAAREAGVEPQQHQLLLAVRGLPTGARPTVSTLAERLSVQHHTVVAMVDKLEQLGLLRRERGVEDRREVLLRITTEGEALLRPLSADHRQHLRDAGPAIIAAITEILEKELHSTPARATTATRPRPRPRKKPVAADT